MYDGVEDCCLIGREVIREDSDSIALGRDQRLYSGEDVESLKGCLEAVKVLEQDASMLTFMVIWG